MNGKGNGSGDAFIGGFLGALAGAFFRPMIDRAHETKPPQPIEPPRLKLTDEMRSMIASAFVAGITQPKLSLCCAPDKLEVCATIVGEFYAPRLQEFFYESLGCGEMGSEITDWEQLYLDKISDLEEL